MDNKTMVFLLSNAISRSCDSFLSTPLALLQALHYIKVGKYEQPEKLGSKEEASDIHNWIDIYECRVAEDDIRAIKPR